MNDTDDLIIESLSLCAEREGDITEAVFDRFYAADTTAYELMKHTDHPMKGRMMEATIELLMSQEAIAPGGYLDWELDNHLKAYAATPSMYDAFFDSIIAVVKDGLGPQWSTDYQAAWGDRVQAIMQRVNSYG